MQQTITPAPATQEAVAAPTQRLPHFPVTFFAVVMGLAGTSLGWTRASQILGAPAFIGQALLWFALITFLAITGTYAFKAIRHTDAVRGELAHPVRLAFVPTASISLLLLATASLESAPTLSMILWWVGMVGQFGLTLYVLSAWLTRPTFAAGHVTPAWFIPPVGMIVVPLAGVSHAPAELSWFAFSVGIVFWVGLLPLVLSRLFLHEQPLPAQLLPTLAILIAPPAVGFLALQRLNDGVLTDVGRVLFYSAIAFFILFVAQLPLLRRLPFFLSWWAYGFPLAALSVAATVMSQYFDSAVSDIAAWGILGGLSVLVALLLVRTVAAMVGGRICVPE